METEFAEYSSKIGAIVLHSILIAVGLSANLLLLYAIVRHTPASFKKYSSLIFLTAINDTVCVLCDSVLIQRILPTPTIIAQVWHGACSLITKESCYYIFSVYLHTMTNSIALITVSFWYRYMVLRKSYPPSTSLLASVVIVLYLPSFVQMVTLPFSMWGDAHVKSELSKYYSTLDYEHGPVTGNAASGDIYADYGTIFALIFPFPCYAFILTFRFKVLRAISAREWKLSDRSREMHMQLVMALSYHACLPIFNVAANTTTAIMLIDIYRHPAMENVVAVFATVPSCLSPILTFIVIRPYREFIMRLIGTNPSMLSVSIVSMTTKTSSSFRTTSD